MTNSEVVNEYAKRLKRLVAESGMIMDEVAKKAGTTAGTISRHISGKHVPRLSMLERIADALGVSPWYLAFGIGGKERQ